MKKKYRPNVAAILQRSDGLLLLGQRSDFPESWQFPQGGIDQGETPEDAIRREVFEEVGVPSANYRIVAQRGPYHYDFPGGKLHRGYHGQVQQYFLCRLTTSSPTEFELAPTCGEFCSLKWVPVDSFPLHLVPPMKQSVYLQLLRDLFPCATDSD